jgi:hypothetical protein
VLDAYVDYRDDDPRNLHVYNLMWSKEDGTPLLFRQDDRTGDWKRVRRNARNVRCIESGVVYESVRDAAEQLNLIPNAVYLVLSGKIRKHHGLSFEWYD